MSGAYIIQDRHDDYVKWKYTENASEIINAPFDGLVFISEEKDKATIIRLLIDTMNYPKLILDNIEIFDFVESDYHLKNIKLWTNPQIDYGHLYYHLEELKRYILQSQKPFEYNWSYLDNGFRKKLNQLGLYVRPTKKILEYNPKKAEIQLSRVKKPKKTPNYLKYHHLAALASALRRVISDSTKIWISTSPVRRYNTKKSYSDEILIMADLCNIIFKKNSYRNFKVFKEAMAAWKETTDKKIFSENFIKWMDYESSLKPTKKTIDKWNVKLKPKAVFKISNAK
jgi:hypothetical protein